MLTTEEAARRLGVKVPTLYAYVSRGLLESHPDPGRRGSLFDLDDIEALAARSRGGRQTATRLATITTAVTQLDQRPRPDLPRPARHRAGRRRPASRRWPSSSGSPTDAGDWRAPDLGPCPLTPTLERMRWALVLCGATDPLRSDLRPAAVARAARRATAALTDVVGPPPAGRGPGRLHRGAARRRASTAVRAPAVPAAAVNAALVLMADHELATSTMAVRVAASVRADPYDALPGRAGHLGRAAARWRQPAGLRAARRGRARRRAAGAERRAARARAAAGVRARRLQERRRPLRRVAGAGRAAVERRAPRHSSTRSSRWRPPTTCRWPTATSPSPR